MAKAAVPKKKHHKKAPKKVPMDPMAALMAGKKKMAPKKAGKKGAGLAAMLAAKKGKGIKRTPPDGATMMGDC